MALLMMGGKERMECRDGASTAMQVFLSFVQAATLSNINIEVQNSPS